MKTSSTSLLFTLLALLAIVGIVVWSQRNPTESTPPEGDQASSIIGCYIARSANDVYTLAIQTQDENGVTGTLSFDNFEKDSSSGTFRGTYEDGLLLGDYSFTSEGMNSLMQVAFQRAGDDFVRGYGDLTNDGTRFTDTSRLTFDASSPLSLFVKTPCSTPSPTVILYPTGGEALVRGQTYTLLWAGGADPIQVFLIDTSLKDDGASVSTVGRVYGVRNTGRYAYTIPPTLAEGTYEFQIGDATSKTFRVVAR